jgi:branched-chain amino acid transport system permease protein
MNSQIVLFLVQDGLINGAAYALIALAVVLVFATTRIILMPQGDFVTLGALSLGAFQLGWTPGTIWLLAVAAVAVTIVEIWAAARQRAAGLLPRILLLNAVVPGCIIALSLFLAPRHPPLIVQALLSVALVTPLGPMVYRLAFEPIANASTRVLFVVAIAVHFALEGLELLFFGPEGFRVDPFIDTQIVLGAIPVKAQSILVVATAAIFAILLYLFFEHHMIGKALRATAVNRLGARIVGISGPMAGKLAFGLAALMGSVSGVLIAGLTTIYFDSGFLIGLKAFVAAIFGGLLSYPLAIAGALAVGVVESFGAFWASAYKDAIVFLLLIPVLLWLSARAGWSDGEDEE